jgi:hypothetical protein
MVTDSFVEGISSMEDTGAQSEARRSLESTVRCLCRFFCPLIISNFFKANHPAPSRPDNTQTINRALSFTSGSTFFLPLSRQKQQKMNSDGSLAGVGHARLFFWLGIKVSPGAESRHITVRPENTGQLQISKFKF